jgi:transposase
LNLFELSVPEGLGVHIVIDNSSTHKTRTCSAGCRGTRASPGCFTPAYGFRLNPVEHWFAGQAIKWPPSLGAEPRRLDPYLDANWNEEPRPYI